VFYLIQKMDALQKLLEILKAISKVEKQIEGFNLSKLEELIQKIQKAQKSNEDALQNYLQEFEEFFRINESQIRELADLFQKALKEDFEEASERLRREQNSLERLRRVIGFFEEELDESVKRQLTFIASLQEPFHELRRNIDRLKRLWEFESNRLGLPYELITRPAHDFLRFQRSVETTYRKIITYLTHSKLPVYTALGLALNYLEESFERYIETAQEVIEQTGIFNRALVREALSFQRVNAELARFGIFLKESRQFLIAFYDFMRTADPFGLVERAAMRAGISIGAFQKDLLLITTRFKVDVATLARNLSLGINTISQNIMDVIKQVSVFASEVNMRASDLVRDLVENYSEFVLLLGEGARNITRTQLALAKYNLTLRDGLGILKNLYSAQDSVIDSLIQIQILAGKPVNFERFFSALLSGDIETITSELAGFTREMRGMMNQLPIFRMAYVRALESLGLTSEQIATILGKTQEQVTGFDVVMQQFGKAINLKEIGDRFAELLRPDEWTELTNAVRGFIEVFLVFGADVVRIVVPLVRHLTNFMEILIGLGKKWTDVLDKLYKFDQFTLSAVKVVGVLVPLLLATGLHFKFISVAVELARKGFTKLIDSLKNLFHWNKTLDKVTKGGGFFKNIETSAKASGNLLKTLFNPVGLFKIAAAIGIVAGGVFLLGKAFKAWKEIDWDTAAKGLIAFTGALSFMMTLVSATGTLLAPGVLTGLATALGAVVVLAGGLYLTGKALGAFSEGLERLVSVLRDNPSIYGDIVKLSGSLAALGAAGAIAAPGIAAAGIGAAFIKAERSVSPQITVKAVIDSEVITAGERLIASKLDRIIELLEKRLRAETPKPQLAIAPSRREEKPNPTFTVFNF